MSWFSRKNRDKEEVLRDKESLDKGLEKTKKGLSTDFPVQWRVSPRWTMMFWML